MIEIRVFGTLEVRGPEDREVHHVVSQSKRAALLAYLAVANGGHHRRDVLVGVFWPEADQRRARNALNQSLHVLRRAIGPEALVSRGSEEVGISEAHVRCDAREFERAIEAGRFADAVALYRGPFLEGLSVADAPAFEEWAREERERFARLHGGALESLAAAAEARGRYGDAARWWRARAVDDPLSGRVTLRLMRALDAAGDRGAAIERAIAHEEALYDQLGAEPDPDVTAYARELRDAPLSRDAVPAPLPANGPAAPSLEEKPVSWPRAIGQTVIVAAALATITGLMMCLGDATESVPGRVLAAPFENRTGDPALDPVGLLAADWITQELAATGLVEVVPSALTSRAARLVEDEPRDPIELARQTGARLLVAGSYTRVHDSLVFQAQVIGLPEGRLLRTIDAVTGPADAPLDAVDPLRRRIAGALATFVDERLSTWSRTASQPPSWEAYRKYADGLDLFFDRRYGESARVFREAAALDSTFTTPLIWALYGHGNAGEDASADSLHERLRAMQARLSPWDRAIHEVLWAQKQGDREGSYEAAVRMAALAPGSEWNYVLSNQALFSNRPRAALEALLEMDPERGWTRQWPSYWGNLSSVYHALGNYEEELRVVRQAETLFPDRPGRFASDLVETLAALGRSDELLSVLDSMGRASDGGHAWAIHRAAREARAHGHRSLADSLVRMGLRAVPVPADTTWEARSGGLWITAGLYEVAGNWQAARGVYERVAREDPDGPRWGRMHAGIAAAYLGDRERAMETDRWLAEQGDGWPDFDRGAPSRLRAEIAAALGDRERAVALLHRAYRQGYGYFVVYHRTIAFEKLRNYLPYRLFVAPRG